jgi:hypothetical protein
MRIAATALGLCFAITASCSSSGKSSEPTPPADESSTPEMAQQGEAAPQQEAETPGDYAKMQAEQASALAASAQPITPGSTGDPVTPESAEPTISRTNIGTSA